MTSVAEQFRQEGRHEGLMKGKWDMAAAMLREGTSFDFVAKVSGLTAEDLAKIMVFAEKTAR